MGNTKVPDSTPAFDSIIKRSDQLYDSGYKTNAIAFIKTAHANAKDLSVSDELNYYTICGDIYRKDLQDYDKYMAYATNLHSSITKHGKML